MVYMPVLMYVCVCWCMLMMYVRGSHVISCSMESCDYLMAEDVLECSRRGLLYGEDQVSDGPADVAILLYEGTVSSVFWPV